MQPMKTCLKRRSVCRAETHECTKTLRVLLPIFGTIILFATAGSPSLVADETAPSEAGIEFFEQKIRPVLLQHCYECHSGDAKSVKGGLLLDTREAVRAGGDSGAAVIPKNIDESLLISAMRHDGLEMPPTGKLPDEVIADFVKWIEMGAPDPRDGKPLPKSAIDFEAARRHWAYQPIRKPELPDTHNPAWCANEIDFFTLAKMESLGLHPVAPAEKRELIRRATFDLIGLPPTPEEIAAFLDDNSPTAFETAVDRLLQSEHYGERWGRHWLDVARYAEDQAHTFSVTENTNGYRYRDWVIRAFNADMPYDKFVKLQIAGDLIGPEQPESYDHLVALGFFGLGAQYYKNSDAAKAAADELDDRVDTLSRGFLGLTVSCARCHDHKFDPVPTQDYYSIAGIFHSSKLYNAPLCRPEEVQAFEAGQQRLKSSETAVEKFLAEVKSTAAESKVPDIARYMEAVWRFRAAAASGGTLKSEELAAQTGLNEFLLKRWIEFLDPGQKGKVRELDAWFALIDPNTAIENSGDQPQTEIPPAVTQVALEFQKRLQSLTSPGDGVSTTNLVASDAPHEPGSPRFVSPPVTKIRPTAGIDIEISGATQLYLVVSDGGNGNSCDHADWIEPRLIGEDGELKLTELKWTASEGFAGARIDTNYQGQPIRVGGKKYPNGIGVHAHSVLTFDVPDGYQRFTAIGGLDNSGSDQGGCGDQASVQFSVYTEKPVKGATNSGGDLLTVVLGKDGPLAVSDQDLENFLSADKREQLRTLRADLEDAKKTAPQKYPIAHSYAESTPQDLKVYVRGNPATQRDLAPRRFLRILAGDNRPHFDEGSGRRQLAEAIASPDNPLTARVMVNRIWQHHFGRGIVNSPSNFGKSGEVPTHPELLDYLASRFIEMGWSLKALHRQIMLSATYRLSSSYDESNAAIDGDNRFLWQMSRQRLDVEVWRDALLDVSGRLDRQLGGPSTNLADENNVRRTVYAKVSRHELDSLLRLFDFPDANITSSGRSETTVPQQQLFVLNSPFMVEQAKAFSARLHRDTPENPESRIHQAFQLAYGRPPLPQELELGLMYVTGEAAADEKLTRWESYCQVLLSSNEFMYLD